MGIGGCSQLAPRARSSRRPSRPDGTTTREAPKAPSLALPVPATGERPLSAGLWRHAALSSWSIRWPFWLGMLSVSPTLPSGQGQPIDGFRGVRGDRRTVFFGVRKMAERNPIASHDTARCRLHGATRKGFSTSLRSVATASRCARRPRAAVGLRDYAQTAIFGGTPYENTHRLLSQNRPRLVSVRQ